MVDSRSHEGKTVRVFGFIDKECQRLSCALSTTREYTDDSVSLDGETDMDQVIQSLAGMPVVMRVRINKPTIYIAANGDLIMTTDRAPEVTPLEIAQ